MFMVYIINNSEPKQMFVFSTGNTMHLIDVIKYQGP